MASNYCIDRKVAEQLKKAVKEGTISMQGLYDMSYESRGRLLEKYVSKADADFVNLNFQKAMVSGQQDALTKWAEATFSPKERKTKAFRGVKEKIADLEKLGVLNNANSDAYLHDLIADHMGISLKPEEFQKIIDNSKELETLAKTPGPDGNPSLDYWMALDKAVKYAESLNPTPNLKVATSVIGRANMLASPKSPAVNIVSNAVNSVVQGFARRIQEQNYKGLNGEYALERVKNAINIFRKSGYDITRMTDMNANQLRLGEDMTHSQGSGPVRAVGRFAENVIFKNALGVPDVATAATAFYDKLELATAHLAIKEGLKGDAAKKRALEIFKDADLITPKTVAGQLVRAQAVADAQHTTYTDTPEVKVGDTTVDTGTTSFSKFSLGVRKLLNQATGNLRLGDMQIPFAKVISNMIESGLDIAGAGFVKGGVKLVEYKLPPRLENAPGGDPQLLRDAMTHFTRAGVGLAAAIVLAEAINPDDFFGDYDSMDANSRRLAQLNNAGFNSFKWGDKYVSADVLGPLSPAFVGYMYAKKYGNGPVDSAWQYTRGLGGQMLRTPGVKEFVDLYHDIDEAVKVGDVDSSVEGVTQGVVDYVRARVVPAILGDLAKGTDTYQRETGRDVGATLKASVPGLRETLPPKVNQVTGEEMKTEGLVSTLLAGSRIQTATKGPIIAEINRLYKVGEGPQIADIRYSTRMKDLKTQISPKDFNSAISDFSHQYAERVSELISSADYDEFSDSEKKDEFNKIRSEVLDNVLTDYGYEKPVKE